MAVAEYVGPDLDGLARDPFDRKPSAIDARIDILNAKPVAQVVADNSRPGLRFHVPGHLWRPRPSGGDGW
jgi:hypothetical protein